VDDLDTRLTRRGSLARIGGLVAGVAGIASLGTASTSSAAPAVSCLLTPELTEGPYYIAAEKVRRDIRDGRPGSLLTLRLSVLDAKTCKSIRNAAVDIWHADAGGVYSGFGAGAASRTFLRGIQRTDAHGLAVFKTIYPGWYPGRTVHIHVKVHLGGRVVHTGQLFFADAFTDRVFTHAPYSKRPGRDTRNANDPIFAGGGPGSILRVTGSASDGYVGSLALGVQRV
jgi:protocatechuate 3,4-dioxygenase beta subunit